MSGGQRATCGKWFSLYYVGSGESKSGSQTLRQAPLHAKASHCYDFRCGNWTFLMVNIILWMLVICTAEAKVK